MHEHLDRAPTDTGGPPWHQILPSLTNALAAHSTAAWSHLLHRGRSVRVFGLPLDSTLRVLAIVSVLIPAVIA